MKDQLNKRRLRAAIAELEQAGLSAPPYVRLLRLIGLLAQAAALSALVAGRLADVQRLLTWHDDLRPVVGGRRRWRSRADATEACRCRHRRRTVLTDHDSFDLRRAEIVTPFALGRS